jgi:hypothetical protein
MIGTILNLPEKTATLERQRMRHGTALVKRPWLSLVFG